MPDEQDTPRTRAGEIITAAIVAVFAAGLLFIAADVLSGGKLTRNSRGCGCDDDAGTGD